jgi:hypothetical protein
MLIAGSDPQVASVSSRISGVHALRSFVAHFVLLPLQNSTHLTVATVASAKKIFSANSRQ